MWGVIGDYICYNRKTLLTGLMPLFYAGKDVPMPYAENLESLALPSEDELIKIIESLV